MRSGPARVTLVDVRLTRLGGSNEAKGAPADAQASSDGEALDETRPLPGFLRGVDEAVPRGAAPASGERDVRALIAEAARVAEATLHENAWDVSLEKDPRVRKVILAGTGKFDALWTRDACFAAFGALAKGHLSAVKGSLETVLELQFPDGLVPRRVGRGSTFEGSLRGGLGISRPKPRVFDTADRIGGLGGLPLDSNLLVLIQSAAYVDASGDRAFLEKQRPALERALGFLRSKIERGILVQTPYSDWKDMTNRGRAVMYNQALYYGALKAMAHLHALSGDEKGERDLLREAEAFRSKVQERFWNPQRGFFVESERFSQFSPDGNVLAVLFGLATDEQRAGIFAEVDRLLEKHALLPAYDGDYPSDRVPLFMKLAGIGHYQDRFAWPWLTSAFALAAARSGDAERAERALARVAEVVMRDHGFFEIYEGEPPKPVRRPLYRAEPNFSFSLIYLAAEDALLKLRSQAPTGAASG